ncbi:MAG: hypothetical protein QOI53_1238 [Verrucomicrobiota bacterium]|jgi:hypothetical protein|nr:hypothetical protein [Verrucomicrobiota bacterium]
MFLPAPPATKPVADLSLLRVLRFLAFSWANLAAILNRRTVSTVYVQLGLPSAPGKIR